MIKTQQQQYYTQAFMQCIDGLLSQIDQSDAEGIDRLLNQASQGLSTTETLVTLASDSLAIIGVVMAVPTAGLSLAGAATAIAGAQTAYNTYKFVQRCFVEENNTLSANEPNAAEKRFGWKIFLREVAEAVIICYGHYINTIATEENLIELANFAAACVLHQIRESAVTQVPLSTDRVLDTLRHTVIRTFDVFNTRQMEIKRTYARPRVVCYSLSAGKIQCTFYASDKKNRLPSEGATSKKYGYMTLSFDDAFSYIKKRNAVKKQLPHDFAQNIQSQLVIYHSISQHEIKDYMSAVHSSPSSEIISFNTFLSQRLGLSVIATCHNEVLQGVDLRWGDFSGVNFRRANLIGCLLENTKWEFSDLDEARLGHPDETISLKGANFNYVYAEKSQWENVDFSESSFLKASLSGALLRRCLLGTLQHAGCAWEWTTFEAMQLPEKNFLDQLNQLEIKVNHLVKRIEALEQSQSPQVPFVSDSPIFEDIPELLRPIYAAYQATFSRPSLQKAMHYYVEPDILPYRTSGHEQRQNLFTQFEHFLSRSEKLFLLQGDVGAGKSFAARVLQHKLWGKWLSERSGPIPFLIELKQVQDGTRNFLIDDLKKPPYHYTEAHIKQLQQTYSFLIILDGWDECGAGLSSKPLLQLCAIHEWNAKALLTARSEWLEKQPDYHRLLPTNTVENETVESFIAPLTIEQIHCYLERRYAEATQPWTYYRDLLYQQKDIQSMIQSPVMLHIICEGDIVSVLENSDQEDRPHNRVWLYETFLQAWFRREILKPYDLENEPAVDDTLLLRTFQYYTQELAFMMFAQNTLLVERQYRDPIVSARHREHADQPEDPWAWFFDHSEDPYIQQAQRSCPLLLERVENIQRYQFIHKSFMEYAASGVLWAALQKITLKHDANNNEAIAVWNHRFLIEELGILTFLIERLQISPTRALDEQRLLVLLYASRHVPSNEKISSSAASLLNRAGFNFSKRARDLSELHLPHTDFSKAPLAFVNFQQSNLRDSNFDKATLVQTSFKDAQLANVYFSAVLSTSHTQNKVIALATHPKHRDLVAYTEGTDLVIIRITDGQIHARYSGHSGMISSLAWCPTRKIIASGSFDNTIRLWDVTTSELKKACFSALKGHKGPVYSVSWSPDGKKLASGSGDKSVCVWDIARQECLLMKGHKAPVYNVSWSYDGQRLASCGADKTIRIWYPNAIPHTSTVLAEHNSEVNAVSWFPDGRLVSGSANGVIRIGLPADNQSTEFITMNDVAVTSVACSLRGSLLAVGNKKGHIFILDTTRQLQNACIATFHDHEERVNSIAWLSEQQIISGSADNSIRTVDIARALRDNPQGTPITAFENKLITCIAWSHEGETLAIGYRDGSLQVVDFIDQVFQLAVADLLSHTNWIMDLAWSSDGARLASGSRDHTLCLWGKNALSHYVLLTTLAEHNHWISKISWSPDNRHLISSSFDSTLRMWAMADLLKSQQAIQLETSHHSIITTSVAWSPDGKQLATGGRDSKIFIWDMSNLSAITCLALLQGHTRGVESVIWSPDGLWLASGGFGTTIRIWNMSTKHCVQILRGHHGGKHLFWDSKNRWLISHSAQHLFFWDRHNNYQSLSFNFGATCMSHQGSMLAFAYQQAVYVFDWTRLQAIEQVAVFGQQNLWIQGSDLTGAQQLSPYTQQWMQQQGAFCAIDKAEHARFFSTQGRGKSNKSHASSCTPS